MHERRRVLFLILTMVAACAITVGVTIFLLYRTELEQNWARLRMTVQSQARLIEAVARYDAKMAGIMREGDLGHDASAATLSQVIDAHERYAGFGDTGEFTLARRDGDSIVFLLRHHHSKVDVPEPIPFDSDLAEAMRRALNGLSGTVIGLDYWGDTVLAAYEPVAELDLGIVAKIDLAEIRAPFVRSALIASGLSLAIVFISTLLFVRISSPMVARLEAYSRDLERTVEKRTKELREAQEELVRKEKLAVLGSLAGGVGHELRNPLGVISNAIYYLTMTLGDADEKTREYLAIVSLEVGNAEKIVSELLGFSRVRAADREEAVVSDLVGQALEKRPPPEEVKVVSQFAPDLPPVFVDPRQIGQVFANLVSNAYQAMPEGGDLTVTAQKESGLDGEANEMVRVIMADTGCGMARETMEKVFEPLFTTRARGIGLGLSVSRKLVEVNGGSITVESEESRGSVFTVVLPTKETRS